MKVSVITKTRISDFETMIVAVEANPDDAKKIVDEKNRAQEEWFYDKSDHEVRGLAVYKPSGE